MKFSDATPDVLTGRVENMATGRQCNFTSALEGAIDPPSDAQVEAAAHAAAEVFLRAYAIDPSMARIDRVLS